VSGKWLTVNELAKLLGVSRWTIYRLMRSGQIGYVNINPGGKHIYARFAPEHVEDFKRRHGCAAGR